MKRWRFFSVVLGALSAACALVLAACGSSTAPTPSSSSVAGSGAEGFVATPAVDLMHSENPDAYRVNVNKPDGLAGDVFYTVGFSAAVDLTKPGGMTSQPPSTGHPNASAAGVRIMTKDGRVVWGWNAPNGKSTSNFRTQVLDGKPVLTWWVGDDAGGHGTGEDYIVDSQYHLIKTITPGDGLTSDVHEFRLTPDGHALITSYKEVTADLSAIGGPKDGKMYDCIASVVDVATGKPLAHWDALQHVPLVDSYQKYVAGKTWDPYHMNSIALDPAGNLVISLRHTSTVYDVNPTSGHVNWRLGGKESTFRLGDGLQFAFQHDAEMPSEDAVTLFNNNSQSVRNSDSDGASATVSSLEWIHLDVANHVATLVRKQTHPDNLVTGAMGNLQQIGNGNTFSNWGTAGHISEFAADGDMLYDVSLPRMGTYRAYFDEWQGMPDDGPSLEIDGATGHALWNGASALSQWVVQSGPDADHLTTVATIPATGFDSTFAIPTDGEFFQVQALNANADVIGKSPLTHR